MFEGEETYLLIASSKDKQSIDDRSAEQNMQGKLRPLKGVKWDKEMFKGKFRMNKNELIETSRDCGILLTKTYVIKWLENYFKAASKDVYLFYTGHGYQNGDWAIQTSQQPHGDILSLEELITLWFESGGNSRAHLYIFLDSCYSASWCQRFSEFVEDLNISIFASCNIDQKSKDLDGGGLMSRCIFGVDEEQLENDVQLLFNKGMKQTPCYINKMQNPCNLSKDHIRLLQKDIRNARNIKQIQKLKTNHTITPNHQTPTPGSNSNQKIRLEGKQNNILNRFMEATGVSQLKSMKNLDKLDLSNKDLIGIPQSISELGKLTELKLSNNGISLLPQSISQLPLKKLYLRNNNISELPSKLQNLVNLQELDISNNPKVGDFYKGAIPTCVLSLKSLRILSMNNINLTNIQKIDQLKVLKHVHLAANRLDNLSNNLCNMTKLQKLCVHDNFIKELPEKMSKMQSLMKICIHGNNLITLPSCIQAVPKLRELMLTISKVSRIELESLSVLRIPNLQVLHVGKYGSIYRKLEENDKKLEGLF